MHAKLPTNQLPLSTARISHSHMPNYVAILTWRDVTGQEKNMVLNARIRTNITMKREKRRERRITREHVKTRQSQSLSRMTRLAPFPPVFFRLRENRRNSLRPLPLPLLPLLHKRWDAISLMFYLLFSFDHLKRPPPNPPLFLFLFLSLERNGAKEERPGKKDERECVNLDSSVFSLRVDAACCTPPHRISSLYLSHLFFFSVFFSQQLPILTRLSWVFSIKTDRQIWDYII